jgi:hypothetical protein
MTDATIVTIAAAIPATLSALGALVVSVANGVRGKRIETKADEIHTLANGNLSRVEANLALANEQIAILVKRLDDRNGRDGGVH